MIREDKNRLIYERGSERVFLSAYGKDGIRAEATNGSDYLKNEWLLEGINPSVARTWKDEEGKSWIENGRIRASITELGQIRFYKGDKVVLEEMYRSFDFDQPRAYALRKVAREWKGERGGLFRLVARFEAREGERIYGMGQHQTDFLNLKGATLELAQRNSQISVPFYLSNLGYGFLWNNPAIGEVSFAKNGTSWRMEGTRKLDYWVTVGDTPLEIHGNFMDLVGRPPAFPEDLTGFWQSKLRYRTEEEVLEVAREYHRREIPLSCIVIDFFHWPRQGEWKFDPVYWPDPKGMAEELESLGVRPMTSIWPTVDKKSENFALMAEQGMLISLDRGSQAYDYQGDCMIADFTSEQTKKFVFSRAKDGYWDKGIRLFWLDQAEPEFTCYDFDNYRGSLGSWLECGNVYPVHYLKAFYEGSKKNGLDKPVSLIRSAWLGSQRYGGLVWSGDTAGTFASMKDQLAGGLSMGIAGIPWWTADIGGFSGYPEDPLWKELLVRWFEWAVFSPVLRLHGDRQPSSIPPLDERNWGGGFCRTGLPNEIWSFGEETYGVLKDLIFLREKIRPYVSSLFEESERTGIPLMRPLFLHYPDDPECWEREDEYLFGRKYLVAPILEAGARKREVYLPSGRWRDIRDGSIHEGASRIEADAPLSSIPVYELLED